MGLVFVASHAAAELVEFGESEAVGAVDDHGVDVGHVDAALDDGGAEEDIGLAFGEAEHDVFEAALGELAVGDEGAGFGHEGFELLGEFVNGLHAVVEEKHLAAAVEFAEDDFADDCGVEGLHVGVHGEAFAGGGLNAADIAGAGEAEVEGAGNGGGGEGEDIDELPHFFEFFFVADAEALFFVDDDQAEVLKADIGGDDAVGADEDIDFAAAEAGDDFALFGGAAEAAEHVDAHGEAGHAFDEALVVLQGEDGGGDEDGGLFAVHDGFEGGAHGDFGFAKADIAADEAVHGFGGLHVGFDGGDGGFLVGGFGVGKGGFEFRLPGGVFGEGVSGKRGAFGLGFEHLRGEVADGAFGGDFLPGPAVAAEGVGFGGDAAAEGGVAGEEVGLADGEVEFGAAGVFDAEDFLGLIGEGDFVEAEVFADAVIDVHDPVAGLDVAEFGDAGAGGPGAAAGGGVGVVFVAEVFADSVEIGFAEHGEAEAGAAEAFGDDAVTDVHAGMGGEGGAEGFEKALAGAVGVEGDDEGPSLLQALAFLIEEGAPGGVEGIGIVAGAGEGGDAFAGEEGEGIGGAGEAVADAELSAAGAGGDEGGKVVGGEQGGGVGVFGGEIEVEAGVVGDAFGVEEQPAGVGGEIVGEGGGGEGVGGGLAGGEDVEAGGGFEGALAGGIKKADGVDLVAEVVDADGEGEVGGPEIDHAAAFGGFAFVHDFGFEAVAEFDELMAEGFRREGHAGGDFEEAGAEFGGGGEALLQGLDAGEDAGGGRGGGVEEGLQAVAEQIGGAAAEVGVGGAFPGGEVGKGIGAAAAEGVQVLIEGVESPGIFGEHHGGGGGVAGQQLDKRGHRSGGQCGHHGIGGEGRQRIWQGEDPGKDLRRRGRRLHRLGDYPQIVKKKARGEADCGRYKFLCKLSLVDSGAIGHSGGLHTQERMHGYGFT